MHRQLVDQYVDAFQRYDIAALIRMMRDDVVLSMPPYDLWLQGPDDVASWFLGQGSGCRGARLLPVTINGTDGFGNYRRAGPGRWEPFALQVIEFQNRRLTGHHNFLDPVAFTAFGLPASIG